MIRKIWADNYKSLKNFQLELGGFNVLIGANASGKSNIIDMLSFVQDSLSFRDGVSGALARREGGKGVAAGSPESITMGLLSVEPGLANVPLGEDQITYELVLRSSGRGFEVGQETLGHLRPDGGWASGLLDREAGLPQNRLALGYRVLPLTTVATQISDWRFLDLNPSAMHDGAVNSGSITLQRNGGNLAELLHALGERGVHDEVRDAVRRDVPGFEDFSTHEVGGQVFFTIDEGAVKGLPATSVSDGTLRLLAIYGLYYSQDWPPLLCIEEPENGLHPDLVESLVDYLRSMSDHCQVIVTTHSPVLVDQCKPEEVVLLEKVEGNTRAVRASERAHITEFLKNFSLGDLWVQNYLDEAA